MIVNAQALRNANIGFKKLYQNAFEAVERRYPLVAMETRSTTAANDYKWLGQIPGLREWLDEKVVHNLAAHGYYLPNKDYEVTIGVDRNDIEDDQLGIYEPRIQAIGDAAARHPDLLVWEALVAGLAGGQGFDGVNFFSTAHPTDGVDPANGTYANRPAVLGTGEVWFLMDDTRPVKPMIFQKRKDYTFVAQTTPESPDVFNTRTFKYGIEARVAVGYGLPQLIYASREPLNATSYAAARMALASIKRPDGSPLGIRGTRLIVGEGNFEAANVLLTNDRDVNGATNTWKGTAKLSVVEYLTGK